ncbi:hypothetical protein SNOG_09780 [Parastagonospora nodorum SN15]|uniref:Uncharacterized protein n=1 Tax=Phaeosphaeria nodorum (strain SN15 / ATCC MYA-4574 / FGSC 10173) TaxID=321614 RepID=Q0UEN4_PHANO|nr:hypothetical protein SNOG_09780 [Parastagonospora nodorum SN15]EAT83045.1 hypothetical protein SNOG_09780 [Parastagonospora nodorum SN15]
MQNRIHDDSNIFTASALHRHLRLLVSSSAAPASQSIKPPKVFLGRTSRSLQGIARRHNRLVCIPETWARSNLSPYRCGAFGVAAAPERGTAAA